MLSQTSCALSALVEKMSHFVGLASGYFVLIDQHFAVADKSLYLTDSLVAGKVAEYALVINGDTSISPGLTSLEMKQPKGSEGGCLSGISPGCRRLGPGGPQEPVAEVDGS